MISEKIAVKDVFYKIKQFKEIISALSILSALIGPIPLLIYFHCHHFFPSIELANHTLLFLYSFTITLLILNLIYFIFYIPGMFFRQIVGGQHNHQVKFIIYYFVIPFVIQLSPIFLIILFRNKFNSEITEKFLSTIFLIVPGIWGFNLSCKLGFSKKSMDFYNIVFQLFFVLLTSSLLFSIIALMLNQKIQKFNFLNSFIIFILSLVITAVPVFLFQKYNIISATLRCILLMTTLLILTNRFPTIADNIIKNMHLGNYQVEEIYLTSTGCQRIQSTQAVAITSYCSLQNVHVLWNFGDQYFLKLAMRGRQEYLVLDKKQDVLNFPKEAEKIINKPS